MRTAIAAAAGFLAGVLLVAILGGAKPAAPTVTVTVTAPGRTTGGPVITRTVVPDVVGERLDVARERVARSGFESEVDGGGILGVLDETNWEVVDQDPRAGFLEQGSVVTLVVDRR
ncbi:MAG TPA: PASTA domain-containing protein [Baekduia sp.]|nr:PASTA domain-containing protein [Baekduia sp.]